MEYQLSIVMDQWQRITISGEYLLFISREYFLPISGDYLSRDFNIYVFFLPCTNYTGAPYFGNINRTFSRKNCNISPFLLNIYCPLYCSNYTWLLYLGNVNCYLSSTIYSVLQFLLNICYLFS